MTDTDALVVTQEDREAAASVTPNNERWGMLVRAGSLDSDPIVRIMSRHRIAAEQRACCEAVEADRRTFSPTEIDQALEAVLNVRAANAGDFKREGAAWEAYDRACLDCHAAIDAIANRNRSQDNG